MLRALVSRRALAAAPRKTLVRTLLTQAYSKGPSEPRLLEQTVGQHFASIVSQHGDRTAVISRHQQRILTYEKLDLDSNRVARGLAKLGVKKGDRVAVSLGNNIEFATITYALFKLGAILVPLNPAFNVHQVIAALAHLAATHLIIGLETNLPFKEPRSNVPLLTHLVPNLGATTHGSAIVFPTEAFDPVATLRSVQEYKCTALYGVPTMFVAEFELLASGAVPSTGFEHLRTGIAAGSSIPAEIMRKLHKILNLTELTICYGMTETSPVSAMTTTDDPIAKRIETVGRLMPHVEAKIIDPADRSRIVGIDERGELAVSGYLVMKEYWGDAARTAEVMIPDEQGKVWMHTGDEASMDEEGYLRITGRIKDLIIRGGENIHPLEVENCLFGHDAIAEVSVVGLPDERYGEVVAAFIVKKHGAEVTADEARNWVREKLSGHLVPKYIFWVDTYPKTASGKIQKFKLREKGVQLVKEGKGLT
ncbi:hypothetical protein B0A49_02066 [Cryomyces minteri]|uniref:Acyl-CoA synthetase YngI n=1 Tax=Cryomyces minteri TaxID=331657 RepID=A0A4U0XQR7_9PEZI|nr:hypothetical protein B0A49_02066 [Cryomyces minteri]